MELLEVGDLLAGGREGDGPADDLLDREGGAATGVAVELGEDHAVEGEGLVERLGDVDGVLAGHRVDDEERVVGLDGLGDLADLLHQLGVDGEAAGGVDDDDVAALVARFLDAAPGDGDGVGGLAEHRHADLLAEDAELLDGGGALEVGADQQRVAALLLEPAGELGRVAVVLPEPCRPAMSTTVGGFDA